MGDIYASAVGTTVLQLKEIPTRPKDFEGALYIGELLEGVDLLLTVNKEWVKENYEPRRKNVLDNILVGFIFLKTIKNECY